MRFFLFLAVILTFLIGCSRNEKQAESKPDVSEQVETMGNIQITSSAFKEGELMPSKYTCDGQDISPPLKWSGVPQNTKSIALICDDPDAPMGTWVHWVIYNIPPTVTELSEGFPATETISNGAKQGITDFKKTGYGGPCPPSGTHRYFFKVYALDTELKLASGAKKKDIENAMKGHILANGQLIGKYKRQ